MPASVSLKQIAASVPDPHADIPRLADSGSFSYELDVDQLCRPHLVNGLIAIAGHDPVDVEAVVHDFPALHRTKCLMRRWQGDKQACLTAQPAL